MKKYFLTLVFAFSAAHADYIWKNGKLIDFKKQPWMSMQEHYNDMMKASDEKKWLDLIENGVVIINHFQNSPFVDETRFLVARAFLEIKDYSRAHDALGQYLTYSVTPKHYEEVMEMKLSLAKAFEDGEIKNLIGLPGIPHWVDARKEAVELYDEIASALPTSFLAEQAVMGKAGLEIKLKDYRLAIATCESFLRKYSKSSLAPEAFEKIGYCQLQLIKNEFLDPDVLSLAELNVNKFKDMYPAHPKLEEIHENLVQMKELFASNMLTTANYYKKVKMAGASQFYLNKIVQLYPETESAKNAQVALNKK
jgi:outer membrane protein assembly factor BamD (BamD/ComL family)